jgi:hypothetical protein
MCQKNNDFRSAVENYAVQTLSVLLRVDNKDRSLAVKKRQENVQPKGAGDTGSLYLRGDDNTKHTGL